jgi:hypothetical protein
MQLRSFGRGFTVFEDRLASELLAEEKELAKDLREFEQLLEKVRAPARTRAGLCLCLYDGAGAPWVCAAVRRAAPAAARDRSRL